MTSVILTVVLTLAQPVQVSGHPMTPGTYEMRVTDQRPPAPSGAPNETQRVVEFVTNGTVVAREVAEVFPPTGARSDRATVQLLKGGEFVRIAANGADGRYLVYLPVSQP